ncbi:MAG: response regulator [Desulfomonile tiedjei]|nr:response regulator [Desulfomonile tiedjei]
MHSGQKQRILIVDDVPGNIKVLINALAPDYKLSVATNGKDALRIAGSGNPPDLILLDIMMPSMDGYEVCRRLRVQEKGQSIPIIFLTAKSDELDEARGLELGAVDYITKPFRVATVKARVKNQLDRKKAEEAQLQMERLGAVVDLASGVAHHFNNMLQVIMGGASVALMELEQGKLDAAKSMLQQIIESSRFGSHTVRRLQEFVKMRTEEAGPEETFDLSHTALQAIETTRRLWQIDLEKLGIHVRLVPNLAKGCFVNGRESELFEVTTSLIRNAVEAMPNGGELAVTTFIDGEHVVLRVEDTGVGIPQEHLGKVFEPFFTTKGFQRVGMGLATGYGIVKSHDGTISVASEPGQGATFTIELPLSRTPPVPVESPAASMVGIGLRILVIDDVEPITTMLAELLGEFGHEVVTALSGEEGLQVFVEQSIDLVICDLGMPDMNGWEVGKSIKDMSAQQGVPKVPFILLTGWGGQLRETTKMKEAGVDAVVEKPMDPSRLRSVIQELAQGRSSKS